MNTVVYKDQMIEPSKVVCVGRNYVAHIEELNNEVPTEPVVFVKPNSAISNRLRVNSEESIHYEAELSFVIVDHQLAGVGFGIDLTKRETQLVLKEKGLPWERAKAFDGSAVFSKFVEFRNDPSNLRLELEINRQLTQAGGCQMMLYQPLDLVDHISDFMSFGDGDILMTGTPSGVGAIKPEDYFVGRIFDGDRLLVEHSWHAQP